MNVHDPRSWDREPHSYGQNGQQQSCGVMGYDGNFVDMSCWAQKAAVVCEDAASTLIQLVGGDSGDGGGVDSERLWCCWL